MASTIFTALTVNEEANLSGGGVRIRNSTINGRGGAVTTGRQNNTSGDGSGNQNGSLDTNTGGDGVFISGS